MSNMRLSVLTSIVWEIGVQISADCRISWNLYNASHSWILCLPLELSHPSLRSVRGAELSGNCLHSQR